MIFLISLGLPDKKCRDKLLAPAEHKQKKPSQCEGFKLVIPLGLEPRTPTLKVLCSTS